MSYYVRRPGKALLAFLLRDNAERKAIICAEALGRRGSLLAVEVLDGDADVVTRYRWDNRSGHGRLVREVLK